MKLRKLNNDQSGFFFLLLPVSIGFILVAIFQILPKLGVGLPGILLEPVVQIWIIIMGVVGGFCIFMRQIFMFIAILLISGILVFSYWGLYIL